MDFILRRRKHALEYICHSLQVCAALLKGRPMLDVFFVAGGFAAFFVAILYVFACDRL
jgi:hypothetical protein